MGKLVGVTFSDDENELFIESTEVEDSNLQLASGNTEKFEQVVAKIKPFCKAIINSLEDLETKPDNASAEFGLNINGEGRLFVVKASVEATIKITLNWNNLK